MATALGIIASHGLDSGRLFSLPGAPSTFYVYRSGYTSSTSITNTLSWTAPTDAGGGTISGYKVEYSSNNSTWSTIYTGSLLTTTHTGIADATACYYRISATNQIGYGTTVTRTQSIVARNTLTTITVPATTNRVAIMCVGGGSGVKTGTYANAGAGGGGVSLSYGISVTPSSTITYAIGAAGAANANGGTSSVTIGTTALSSTGGTISATAYRGGSSGTGTVSQGTSILASTSKLGGTGSGPFSDGGYFVTYYEGAGGGAGASGVGGNGFADGANLIGTGGTGGAGYTYFGISVAGGTGGAGTTSTGSTWSSSYGGGTQSGAVIFHYFS